jgi:signal peptidase
MSDIRTVNDFNKEYLYRCWCDEIKAAGQPSRGATIRSAVFYTVLATMVLLAFFYSGDKNPGKRFGPFAYNTVLSPSMQDVYPQGSMVFSWAIKPDEPLRAGLADGSDIVFLIEGNIVVVHRIIEIISDYENLGIRVFRTQGVNNNNPDSWLVYEGNIVGRVTGHVPYAGMILSMIADNIFWVIGGIVFICALVTLLKIVFSKEDPKPQKNKS